MKRVLCDRDGRKKPSQKRTTTAHCMRGERGECLVNVIFAPRRRRLLSKRRDPPPTRFSPLHRREGFLTGGMRGIATMGT